MLGAISRAYYPGCKFDYVPIIYGTQGCGKSTFCRALAMDDAWYDDNFNTIEGDKAAEKLRGLWMAELAELLATKKAKELESIKSFLTSRGDNYRPPYNRRTENRKRVCVFIGTTNSDHFLTDRTGNRRFLPLIANKDNAKTPIVIPGNYEKALIDIRNAWGEAMDIMKKAGMRIPLILPADLSEDVMNMQRRFQEDDPQVGMIQSYLDGCKNERVCVLELWEEALHNTGKPSKYESNLIHTIMQQEISGWTRSDKKQRCSDYGVQICYEREDKYIENVDDQDLPFKI
jgi:predicted P-loop ATPase